MKKKMKIVSLACAVFFVFPFALVAQSGLELSASLTEDFVGSVLNETKGTAALGVLDFTISLNTEEGGLWKGGEAMLWVENTHGGTPSEEFIEDMQVVSNIEAGDGTVLYEAWFKQQFGSFSAQLGIIDLNSDLQVSETGGYFINSSFGVAPTASANQLLPIFPKPSLGALFSFNVDEKLSMYAGVWDGDPGDLGSNKYNTNITVSKDNLLFASEVCYKFAADSTENLGQLKLGAIVQRSVAVGDNISYHLLVDKTIVSGSSWRGRRIDAFGQLGLAPDQYCDFYVSAGAALHGVRRKAVGDVLSFAIGNMHVDSQDGINGEMIIELDYIMPLYEHLFMQPSLQCVCSGLSSGLKTNALVGILRFVAEL